MKMKKWKCSCLILMLSLLVLLTTGKLVKADLIIEPEDSFYKKNSDQCEQVGRMFTANGSDGYVVLMKNPESSEKITTYENGTTFLVRFSFTDENDNKWGVVEVEDKSGWIRMDTLEVIYDNISFFEDHQSEFKDYQDELDGYQVKTAVLFWTYPGSGKISAIIENLDNPISISYTYSDQEGRLWGYVGYYYASEGWICMSDPENENLPIIDVESNSAEVIEQSYKETSTNDTVITFVLFFLVAAVMIVTAVIIHVFWRKEKMTNKKKW